MDLRMELRYPATPDAVGAMLGDRAFHARVAEGTGALSYDVETAPTADGGLHVRLFRRMPPVVPDFVRRFVGDSLDVTETNDWEPPAPDGSRTGRIAVDIDRTPLQMRGTTALSVDGDGTLHVIAVTLKASVPFIGAKIEESAAGAVRLGARKQEEVAREWLG